MSRGAKWISAAFLTIALSSPVSAQGGGGGAGGSVCWQLWQFVAVAGAGNMDQNHISLAGNLICGLARAGYYGGRIDGLYVFATISPTTVGLINLLNPSNVAVIYGSPVCVVDQGCSGIDGSTMDYIDTTFVPPSPLVYGFGQPSSGPNYYIGAWVNNSVTPTLGGAAVGATSSACTPALASGSVLFPEYTNGNWYGATDQTPAASGGAAPASGYVSIQGLNDGMGDQSYFLSVNGITGGIQSTTPVTDPGLSLFMLGCNSGGVASLGNPNQVAVVVIGGAGLYLENSGFLDDRPICTFINSYLNGINGTAQVC